VASARTLALFAALTVVHTWPLATAPATLSRNDNADTILNEWALAWNAHQLVRAPLDLFDANIFHPEPDTLAYSEHMIVQSLMGLPLFWLGAPPVLVYNLLLMAGFALSGWAMYTVVLRWTGDRVAAFASGSLMAFNAHVFTRLPHLQALHVEFLPFAALALDRLLASPAPRHAAALGAFFALQGLTSNYWLAFITMAFVAATLARPEEWSGGRLRRVVPMLALAAAIAVAAIVPFLWPYYRVVRDQGLVRSLDDVALYSGNWRDYLSTGSQLHFPLWSHRIWASGGRTALFPGFVGLALAAVAIGSGVAWRDRRARLWLAMGLAGGLISLGVSLPGYAWLYRLFPLLQGMRAPVRMGHVALVAVAALAGFGLAHLRRGWTGRRWAGPVSVALVLAIHAEAVRAPIHYTEAAPRPAVYATLAGDRRAVVAEFPFPDPRSTPRNAAYMLNSTLHWRPMLNGYSGFVPPSYVRHWEAIRGFPDPPALAALRDAGVTHVIVHEASVPSPLGDVAALRPLAREGTTVVYALRWDRIGR
jgi:hypothetical protein